MVRPSAKTSIFAPTRCGVEPLARTIVTSALGSPRSSAAAAAGRTASFTGPPRSDENLDLGLLLQSLDEGVLVLLLFLLGEELLDLLRRLLERDRAARLAVDHFDDVISERRRDHVADLPRLQLEGDLVERRHHR